MAPLRLKTCPFLGPTGDDGPTQTRELPSDYDRQPFKYLPPKVVLPPEELELASRYESGNCTTDFLPAHIALIRRGPCAEQHRQRRETFRRLKAEVDRAGLVLPAAYVTLVENDDYIARLRCDTIHFRLPDELAPLPSAPDHQLFLIFGDCQGCGYWHLLLAPDGGHIVTFSEYPFGCTDVYPPGHQPDPAAFEVYQCTESFSQWIVLFFLDIWESDRKVAALLAAHGYTKPGE